MPNVQTVMPSARGCSALSAVLLLLSVLLVGLVDRAHAREQPAQSTQAQISRRADGSIELRQLRAQNLSGPQAAAELRRLGNMGPLEVARVLAAAEYTSEQIEEALVLNYNLSTQVARRHVTNAQATPLQLRQVGRIPRGVEVTNCVNPDGSLFQCPAGSPPEGPTVPAQVRATAMNWSGVTLQPDNDAVAGAQLHIRQPAGATLPPVAVQLAGQTLPIISSSPQEVRVQLPATSVSGALTMLNLNNELSGTLASEYRVRQPGVLDALQSGHSSNATWRNSYLMGLLSYYIYSDSLGSVAQFSNNFRNQMLQWGAYDMQFVDVPNMHLRAAVVWGRDWVVVVFRGSEQHSTAYCMMEMVYADVCANLPTNWIMTNLAYRPLRQRPEWGANVRTHPGFDEATDQLYEPILALLGTQLTQGRRLYVTGHSLGGAMATLFAYRAEVGSGIDVHGLYTFGAPRVGNIPFAMQFPSALHNKTQRWQNRSDPAPGLPPGQPIQLSGMPAGPSYVTYRHVGRLNYIPAQGGVEFNRQAEPVQPATTAAQLATSDHSMAGMNDAYLQRMYQVMPNAIRATLPSSP